MRREPFDFEKQLKKQKEFYEAFVSWTRERVNVIGITEADKDDQKKGIDFWAIAIGENSVPVEVKCDFRLHETGNIAVETVANANITNWQPGWLSKLYNSHLLVIIEPEAGDFHILDSQAFYWRVVEYMNMYKAFSARNKNKETGEEWWGMGVLVPVHTLTHVVVDKGNIYHLTSGNRMLMTKRHRDAVEEDHAEKTGSISG